MKLGETSAMGHYAAPSSTPPSGMRFMTCSLMGSVTHLYTYKSRLASSSIGRFLRDWAAAGLTDTLQSQKAGTWSPSECTARPGPLRHMLLLTHPLWPPLVHAAGCLPRSTQPPLLYCRNLWALFADGIHPVKDMPLLHFCARILRQSHSQVWGQRLLFPLQGS